MLSYLPERLYEVLKEDSIYHQLSDEYTDEIIGDNGYIEIIKQFYDRTDHLKEILSYMRDKMPENYLLEYDLVMSDNQKEFANRFDEMDVETKIYYLYAYDNGDMSWSEEAEKRNQLCIKLYEENILDKEFNGSLFIHTIYYLRKVYELIYKYSNRRNICSEFDNFVNEESEIFEKMMSISDNESYKHIMFSKREQMYGLFLEIVGQFYDDLPALFDKMWTIVNNELFKYNDFSYFKTAFFLIFFQEFMDNADIDNAVKCLDKLMSLVKYGFENRYQAVRSLMHYNKAFLDDFLVISRFIYTMVERYMPNLFKSWGVKELLKPSEYRFFYSMLTNDDKKIVQTFNVSDRFFGYAWLPHNSEIFALFDEILLTND